MMSGVLTAAAAGPAAAVCTAAPADSYDCLGNYPAASCLYNWTTKQDFLHLSDSQHHATYMEGNKGETNISGKLLLTLTGPCLCFFTHKKPV